MSVRRKGFYWSVRVETIIEGGVQLYFDQKYHIQLVPIAFTCGSCRSSGFASTHHSAMFLWVNSIGNTHSGSKKLVMVVVQARGLRRELNRAVFALGKPHRQRGSRKGELQLGRFNHLHRFRESPIQGWWFVKYPIGMWQGWMHRGNKTKVLGPFKRTPSEKGKCLAYATPRKTERRL